MSHSISLNHMQPPSGDGAPALAGRGGAAKRQTPRSVTTGGKNFPQHNSNNLAHIDWLAFTFTPSEGCDLAWFWNFLHPIFGVPCMQQIDHLGQWNGYTTIFDLGGHGLLGMGGAHQNGTIHVSLSGIGCAHITDWIAVQSFLESINAKITRVDLAHDDIEGESINMENAVQWYRDGLFVSGGRNPKHRVEGDWLDPESPQGRTLYIGKKANGKLCCIYEKGKQLGDRTSPWVRVEVRLGGKSRIIPLDVLTRPGVYLVGAYPEALGFLSVLQEKIRTISKVVQISLGASIHHTRMTGGKLINLLRNLYQGDDAKVIEVLRRDGVPKRLEHYSDFVIYGAVGDEDAAPFR